MTGPFAMEINEAIYKSAETFKLEPSLVMAIVKCESNGDPWAVRYEKGYKWLSTFDLRPHICSYNTEVVLQQTSFGLMQVMGANFREYGYADWLNKVSSDIAWQLRAGCLMLSQLLRRYKTVDKAISAYNAGSPTDSNKQYVRKVLDAERLYRQYNPGQF